MANIEPTEIALIADITVRAGRQAEVDAVWLEIFRLMVTSLATQEELVFTEHAAGQILLKSFLEMRNASKVLCNTRLPEIVKQLVAAWALEKVMTRSAFREALLRNMLGSGKRHADETYALPTTCNLFMDVLPHIRHLESPPW